MDEPAQITQDDVDESQYWVFKTAALEWLYVLGKIVERHNKDGEAQGVVYTFTSDGATRFMLLKSIYPSSELVKALGVSQEALEKQPMLTLQVPAKDDLPDPTVSYWGEA